MIPIVEAVVAANAIVAAVLVWYLPKEQAAPVSRTEPLLILVADFDNATDESLFDNTIEEALQIALEGATFISVYCRNDARKDAQTQAGGPTLSLDNAKLVAARNGIDLIATGSIESSESGYALRLAKRLISSSALP